MADEPDPEQEAFLQNVGVLGPALLQLMAEFEQVARHLDPQRIGSIRTALTPRFERFEACVEPFAAGPIPSEMQPLAAQLQEAVGHMAEAGQLFVHGDPERDPIASVLGAMHAHCLAQQAVFPLREVFPAFDRFFIEPEYVERLPALRAGASSGQRIGLFNASNAPEQRGGFSLFVPESYTPDRDWPLIVALHGGTGHGGDFIWSWLREARSRDHLLLAPTSRGSTWSFNGPDVDADALGSMLAYVGEHWRVDAARMLLTGLSDGGTYTLLHGLAENAPFSHLAPLSGVMHPMNLVNGNLERAARKPIYLVHGERDWMFPVDIAREAKRALSEAGAELVYREIADLSHAYAREENVKILEWMNGA
jgi:phospholipase/carboxylesterase